MKNFIIVGLVTLSLIAGAVFISKSNQSTPTHVAGTSTNTQSFAAIQKTLDTGAQLIDVRTAEEYAAGHITGATNVSLQAIQAGSLPSGNKQQTVYVYCHSGNRSRQATAILKNAGYTNIIDLGGIAHVQAIGGTIVKGS